MNRRHLLVGLGLLPLVGRAATVSPSTGGPTGVEPAFLPLRRDAEGRALIRATLDGHGTCDLVIDTAATRTALTPDAVERLGLALAPGNGVRVHGTTGATRLALARVPLLGAGDARLEAADVPVLPRYSVPGADGLLGTDALAGCTLALDFQRGTLAISRTTRAARRDALVATHRFEGAIAVGAKIGNRIVPAIVDTGAARTLGTPLLASLCSEPADGGTVRRGTVRGIDLGRGDTIECDLPDVTLGRRRLERIGVGCIALPAFEAWRLAGGPALLLGMDVLGRLDSLRLDFATGLLSID
jgi:predicted aspartyl protease